MNEFIEQFILESRELIEQASATLSALEQSPQHAEYLDATFRAIHTLKGGAAIVDFFAMERAVHAVEDAFGAIRAGRRTLTVALVTDCFACLDLVSRWLNRMEQSAELPTDADAEADRFVARMTGAERPPADPTQTVREAAVPLQARTMVRFAPHADSFLRGQDPLTLVESLPGLIGIEFEPIDLTGPLSEFDPFECRLALSASSTAGADQITAHLRDHLHECEIRTLDREPNERPATLGERARTLLEAQLALLDEQGDAAFAGRVASAGIVAGNVLRRAGQTDVAERIARATEQSLAERNARHVREAIASFLATPSPAPIAGPLESTHADIATRSFRVDAERVDALVRLTGELTVVKNAIGHVLKRAEGDAHLPASLLKGPHGDLDHLIGELQRAVLGIRVLPLRNVFQRLPRLVREISIQLDKPVKLSIDGDDTEADKAIVEMLFEPLLHIVRNAMDHGIETASERRERNKPAVANVRIRAAREGGHVLVEVEDDGGGVDVARVRSVARQRGLVESEALDAMSDAQIINLVFAPGFSTAAQVTGLSGRGVGMDAVRTAVERVGGRVTIDSRAGLGTTIKLLLPFSVMLTRVMTVEAGGQMFGIPLDAIVETLTVDTDQIVGVGAARAIVHRNRTLPLFELAGLMQLDGGVGERNEAVIVVAEVAGQLGGLRVERVGERMDVMLRPLEGLLADLRGIAGTTILGDGRVLLVLDLPGVLQ